MGGTEPARVLLVGARAAGKSVVGAALAGLLDLPFLDLDAEIERASGRPVAALLRDGSLRRWEARLLPGLLARERAVLATGGGAVLAPGFAEACAGWRVVWLDADPAVLARRIRADPTERPALHGTDAAGEAAAVARERAPLYRSVAERRVDTGRDDPSTIARKIASFLRSR